MKADRQYPQFQKPDPDAIPSIPPAHSPGREPNLPPAGRPPGEEADEEALPVPPIFPTA